MRPPLHIELLLQQYMNTPCTNIAPNCFAYTLRAHIPLFRQPVHLQLHLALYKILVSLLTPLRKACEWRCGLTD